MQDDDDGCIGCFVPGECVVSVALTAEGADSANDCLERCREHDGEDCGDFNFHFDTKVKHKKTTLRIE